MTPFLTIGFYITAWMRSVTAISGRTELSSGAAVGEVLRLVMYAVLGFQACLWPGVPQRIEFDEDTE
jgi:hypothetical protein